MQYITTYDSPIGTLILACEGENLIGLWNEDQKYFGSGLDVDTMTNKADIPVFQKAKKWLDEYFAGKNPQISELPLAPAGSEFRKQVWDILCEIPSGETVTYGDIAKQIAKKMGRKTMSSQAVGGAVGHNPISIIIPCHRVVGSNGNMTGYAGGIEKKIKLLDHEKKIK